MRSLCVCALRCSVRCKVVRCGLPYTYIRPYVMHYVRCRCNLALLNHTINKVAIIDLISVHSPLSEFESESGSSIINSMSQGSTCASQSSSTTSNNKFVWIALKTNSTITRCPAKKVTHNVLFTEYARYE